MRTATPGLRRSVELFASALHDYHAASLQMSQALARLIRHNDAFRAELSKIAVVTTMPCQVEDRREYVSARI